MKNDTVLPDCIIPVGYDSFIHHLHTFEWSVAEANDIPMIKMGVRYKEHIAAIKFIVHFFLNLCTSLHVNNLVINRPSDGNARRAS